MSRPVRERLSDIQASCAAIADYLARDGADDDMVFDAIRVRLIEIGEAVKDIDPKLLESEPAIPWTEISRMRDQLAHRFRYRALNRSSHRDQRRPGPRCSGRASPQTAPRRRGLTQAGSSKSQQTC